MTASPEFQSSIYLQEWEHLLESISNPSSTINVGGESLKIASIIAAARYKTEVRLDQSSLNRLATSTAALEQDLKEGKVVYGVNTGFGGNADTRTQQVESLQNTLITELQYGIMYPPTGIQKAADLDSSGGLLQHALPLEDLCSSTCMPEAWVRAAILIRINSLMSGASGIREIVVSRMLDLLRHDIVPFIPLHGSISASGDLSPLSYIGACIQGKQNLLVMAGRERRMETASVALAEKNLMPVRLAAKEGLALVNGTAISSAIGALVLHDAHGLAVLSQVLTAMSVEALCGTDESFHPFFAAVRPHSGQIEAAHNIFAFLHGSQLTRVNDGSISGALRQDRYSVRTASQWIGPVLEDLLLAHKQIEVECNSVTDNPLIEPSGVSLHGGNFQARTITSATEKIRQGLQSLGRMLFVQCTELINPTTNQGLPPNLVVDPPSQSFIMKAVDLLTASLLSELGFLANPVGSHVQTAEMGNQSLNSLALISARYTLTATDILSKLAAAHLLALCQALDLRAIHEVFLNAIESPFKQMTNELLSPILKVANIHALLWQPLLLALANSTTMDPGPRFTFSVSSLQPIIISRIDPSTDNHVASALQIWAQQITSLFKRVHDVTVSEYLDRGNAAHLLGRAARRMYRFVRQDLQVPFLHSGILQPPEPEQNRQKPDSQSHDLSKRIMTVGDYITVIHKAIRNGNLFEPAMTCLKEVRDTAK